MRWGGHKERMERTEMYITLLLGKLWETALRDKLGGNIKKDIN
jgi:hypothetical protein